MVLFPERCPGLAWVAPSGLGGAWGFGLMAPKAKDLRLPCCINPDGGRGGYLLDDIGLDTGKIMLPFPLL